jgi:hypothetical protein
MAQESAAQAGSPQAQSSSAEATQDQVFRKVEGCLAYNGVSYVLAVVSNGPKQYRVVGGDVEALHGKVGHTIEIDGVTGRNDPREMIMNWDQREATTGVGWYTISAERVRDVTSNCSYPGFEHPLSHVTMN